MMQIYKADIQMVISKKTTGNKNTMRNIQSVSLRVILAIVLLFLISENGLAQASHKGAYIQIQGDRQEIYSQNEELLYSIGPWTAWRDEDHLIRIHTENGMIVLDEQGMILIQPKWDYVFAFHGNYAVVRKDWKYGVIDRNGSTIIDATHEDIVLFDEEGIENGAFFAKGNGKYFLLDSSGSILRDDIEEREFTPPFYHYSNGFACVRIRGKYGYLDYHGDVVIDPIYDEASDFQKNIAVVLKDGKWSIIDQTGSIIANLDACYEARMTPSGSIITGMNAWNDQDGQLHDEGAYISSFEERGLKRLGDGKWEYYNIQYLETEDINAPRYFARGIPDNDHEYGWYLLDENGSALNDIPYDEYVTIGDFSSGLARIQAINENDGRLYVGFINLNNEYVIEAKYSDADEFYNGRTILSKRIVADGEDAYHLFLAYTNGKICDCGIYNWKEIETAKFNLAEYYDCNSGAGKFYG